MTEATAMGLRVYVNVPRPAREIVEGFVGRSTCHICDAMNRFGAMDHRIKPVDPSMKMAGTALTVRARPCDNLVIYKALEIARPGDVIVIGIYEYNTNSTWGDLTTTPARPLAWLEW